MIENEEEIRTQINYYQDLLDVCETPPIKRLRGHIQTVAATTKNLIGVHLLKVNLSREDMEKILDDALQTRGIIQGLETVIEMINPESLKIHLENLQEELKQEPDDE